MIFRIGNLLGLGEGGGDPATLTWLPYHHVEVLFNNTFTEVTIRLESGNVHT